MALAPHHRTARLALRPANVLGKLGFRETGRDLKHCRARGVELAHVNVALMRADFG